MKASEYIKEHGDFEITEEMEECIPYKPKSVWDLEEGDICYYVDEYNRAKKTKWNNMGSSRESRRIGLIALTQEELEFKIESMKVYEELKRFAKEFTDEEWHKSSIYKYYLYVNYVSSGEKDVYIEGSYLHKNGGLYFESRGKAREAIAAVGEDRIKKYYLGVKE